MTARSNVTAKCLCGQIGITVKSLPTEAGVCHCTMCRAWSCGPFMAIDCGTEVEFTGKDNIASFASSQWAERGFCNHCGTHLFYRLNQTGQYMMSAGLFDAQHTFNFDHQIFIEEKPDYYCFANDTKNMTGEEVFAQFSQPNE